VRREVWRNLTLLNGKFRRSQWPHGVRRGSAPAGLLVLRARTPSGAWRIVWSLRLAKHSSRLWSDWR